MGKRSAIHGSDVSTMVLRFILIALAMSFGIPHDDCAASGFPDRATPETDVRMSIRDMSPVDHSERESPLLSMTGQERYPLFPYRISWRTWLETAPASELRNPIDARVFVTQVDPTITLKFQNSFVDLHGRGIRYRGAHEAWSLGLQYRKLDMGPDLDLRIDDRTERPKVLKVEWRLAFD